MRNYAVLHIVAEESRIFKTKARCPLLLCIEVYRPTEIALETIPSAISLERDMSMTNSSRNSKRPNNNLEIQSMSHDLENMVQSPFGKTAALQAKKNRSQTMTTSQYPFETIKEEEKQS